MRTIGKTASWGPSLVPASSLPCSLFPIPLHIQSRLTGILNPLNERTTIQWDSLDRELHKVLGNGMAVSHAYDANGNETVLSNISAAGVMLFGVTNTYDLVGNRLSVLESDGTQCQFSYDPTRQIVNEQRTGAYAYNTTEQALNIDSAVLRFARLSSADFNVRKAGSAWDPLGNRLEENNNGQITSRSFNAANAQIVLTPPSGPATTSVFDPVGNLLTETTGSAITTNTWSAENQVLQEVKSDGTTESYLYAQNGQRKRKINGLGTTYFTHDDQNILLETDGSNNLLARNTNNRGTYGGLVSQNRSSASSFYGCDSQRSTRILVSIGGTVTDNYSYKVFGVELQSGSGTVNPFRFGGQVGYFRDFANEMDGNAMVCLPIQRNCASRVQVPLISTCAKCRGTWWRKLNAINGRWNSRDKIGFRAGDANLMRFVGNNPVVWVDPSGMAVLKLYVNAFIDKIEDKYDEVTDVCGNLFPGVPGPWAVSPFINLSLLSFHQGDHRHFFEPGTARVHAQITLDTCKLGKLKKKDITYSMRSDPSIGLKGFLGSLCLHRDTGEARPYGDENPYFQRGACTNEAESWIGFDLSAAMPLVILSPEIHFDAALVVRAKGNGWIAVSLVGNHTGYPWFEAWASTPNSGAVRMLAYSASPGNVLGLLRTVYFNTPDFMMQAMTPPCECPCLPA